MSPPITASITLTMTKTKFSSKAGEVPKRRDLVHRTYVHGSSVWKLEANLPIITIFLGNCDIFVVQFDPWSYLELMKNCPLLALPIGSDGKRMKSGFWEIDVDWFLYEFLAGYQVLLYNLIKTTISHRVLAKTKIHHQMYFIMKRKKSALLWSLWMITIAIQWNLNEGQNSFIFYQASFPHFFDV